MLVILGLVLELELANGSCYVGNRYVKNIEVDRNRVAPPGSTILRYGLTFTKQTSSYFYTQKPGGGAGFWSLGSNCGDRGRKRAAGEIFFGSSMLLLLVRFSKLTEI